MKINQFEDGLKLAQEFLTSKKRDNYHEFKVFYDDHGEECIFLNHLTDAQVTALRSLKEKYGEEFVKHLDEVYDNPDTIHDLTGGCEILDIDLENVSYKYAVTIHELESDGTLSSIPTRISLSDEEYARLIAWHLYDEHFTMNMLRHRDGQLYDIVMSKAENYYTDMDGYCLFVSNPYLITLDEAKADAEIIVKQHEIERSGAYIGF